MEKMIMSFEFATDLMNDLALLKLLSKGNGTKEISMSEEDIRDAEEFAREVFNELCDGLAEETGKEWIVEKND